MIKKSGRQGGMNGLVRALLAGHLTWNIPILFVLLGIMIAYIVFVKKHHRLMACFVKPLLFFIGIGLLYLSIGSPLLSISYLSFSLHMIQMSFLFFIIPPLILLGIPHHLYKKMIDLPLIRKINVFNLSPKGSLITFAVLFLFYHLPIFLTFISQQPLIQKGYIALLFMLSFRMWWPIASPNPQQRLSKQKMKRYAVQSGWVIMPACLLFIVSALLEGVSNPFLVQMTTHLCIPPDFSPVQLLPSPFNTKYDQMMAGFFMIGLHKFGLVVTYKLGRKY